MRTFSILTAVAGILLPLQTSTPPDPEATAREALARPVSIGSVPFLLQHSQYPNVASRLADALRHKQPEVRAVAARSIYMVAAPRYAAPISAALAVERDPTAGAEMVRALLAIRGAAADADAIAAAKRFGPEALNAISTTLAHSRPLDVLPWLDDLRADTNGLPDALRRAMAVDPERVKAALQTSDVEPAPPNVRWTRKTEWRLSEPFLVGLDAAVARVAGCRPKSDEIALVRIGFGPNGQVRQRSVDVTRASPECRQAAAALAGLEIPPVGDGSVADRTDYVVSVFTRDALECERRSARGQPARRVGQSAGITEPRKLHDVGPVYPKQLITARIQGRVFTEAVIDRAGCVSRAFVLNDERPEFIVASLGAIAQWRYEPTLLNGEPVAVIMVVSNIYSLK